MRALAKWNRSRKSVATTLVFAVIVGVPLTIATLHPGYPVDDVDLTSRDVWVTNGEQLLGGRLNRQIDELNGAVTASTPDFDVLQDGDTLFLFDPAVGRVESVSAASTTITSSIEVPVDSEVTFGGSNLVVVSPDGELWVVSALGDLQFDAATTDPILELGAGGHAVVTREGAIVAVSAEDKKLYRIDSAGGSPQKRDVPALKDFQISAVGEQAVILDETENRLIKEDGTAFELDQQALWLQQVGPEADYALLATADSLLEVSLGSGSAEEIPADIANPVNGAEDVSRPVSLDGCAHGAWAGAQRYLLACDDRDPDAQDISEPTQGDRLEFRVNRSVIALNNLTNGDVWLIDDNMRLVQNWEDVTPPEEQEGEEGDEKSSQESFEDTLAERTEVNRTPIARDDQFGARPERTTILPLLDNDTDPDGDVLVITNVGAVAESTGKLDYIDGGRALQFTPADGYVGAVSFQYQVDDGRPNGSATAQVTVQVRGFDVNELPASTREAGVVVETNQTVSYNVLADWKDPDGDDLSLVTAAPKSGDLVRYTSDGFITFTHATSEIGQKEVTYLVSDGRGEPVEGTLLVDVQAPGSLNPIGTPDYADALVNQPIVIEPLANDLSPSGAQLQLLSIEEPGDGAAATLNTDQGIIGFQASDVGSYYIKYTLGAGANTSQGIIRVQVRTAPSEDLPPIAVKDTAYLRGEEPTTVSVLSNDVSPMARVLAVQSAEVAQELKAKGLEVEVLESTLIRITSPAALEAPVQFSYTISDGVNVSRATVTVVPVPPLTRHQPPVAENDVQRVRAGDIVTVDVLRNDFHPDGSRMFLDDELEQEPSAGIAFVNENTVRFQAPDEPGTYSLVYRVLDPYGESGAATVTFTVTAPDEKNNQDPAPVPLVGRTLASGQIRVDIPLQGVDPDGDSVQLLDFPAQPSFGSIIDQGLDYFVYEAVEGAAGTDVFSYRVFDGYGATGEGEIRIAVIPEPTTNQPPSAVPDAVSVRPGRIAQVDLLANDSDPQSAPIKVSKKLIDVPDGIDAEVVDERYLVVEAPDEERAFSLRYTLTNNRGGSDVGYVQVTVTPDAPLLPPTADDVPIETKEIAGKDSITVNLLDYAFNPAGRDEDLVVSLEGPNASSADKLERNGYVEVTPGETRQAIAYRVTNEQDELSAMAFILVPAATGEEFDDPPVIDPALPTQYVSMNETKSWDLSDIVFAPSGRDVLITDERTVRGIQSNGKSNYVDENTLTFTPPKDYRGPAAILFEVTDGSNPDDPKGNVATLRLPIIVGDPEFRDTPPQFTPPSVNVEVGEQTTIDLRASTQHPNAQILQEVTYSNLTGAGPQLQVQQNGSQLTISTPRKTPKGTTFQLGVTLRWGDFEVPGTVNVTVVSSSRPLAVANTDSDEARRGDPAKVYNVLANDSNPYETTGEPLEVVDARVESDDTAGAAVSFTGTTVSVRPSGSLVGTITVVYTVQDATGDPDRRVNGRVVLVVTDVPGKIAPAPVRESAKGSDRRISYTFTAPASNGKNITNYEISTSPALSNLPQCVPGQACVLTAANGVQNGTAYTLSARAFNERGWGAWSDPSQPMTPYGTPGTIERPTRSGGSPGYAPENVTWSWGPVSDTGGGTVTYRWELNSGQTGTTRSRSTQVDGLGAGDYRLRVLAINDNNGNQGPWSDWSFTTTIENEPPPPPMSVEARRGDGMIGQQQCSTWSCAYPAMSWTDADPGRHTVCYENTGNDATSGCDIINMSASGSHQFTGQGFRGWPANTLRVWIQGGASDTRTWGNARCLDTGSGCRNGP